MRPAETNDMRLLYVHVRFCKFQVVSQSCNMLQLCVELCSSVFPACRYVLNIISVQILNKCDETSLTVICIAVSFWNKYEFGTDKPCIYRGPDRSAVDRFSYSRPNGFTCESDPVWSCTVPASMVACPCKSDKIEGNPCQSGSDLDRKEPTNLVL